MSQEVKIITAIIVITIVIVAGGVFLLGKSATKPQSQKVDSSILIRDDSYKIATSSAKVTMVEFSDFQCPACAAVEPTIRQMLADYQGKINFVYRHFPLPQHQNAVKAALAAEAAGVQGKFWPMHDKLFDAQKEWENSGSADDLFVNYAKDLGLDSEKFKLSLEDNKLADKIKRDEADGTAAGVNSTPTFFVDGVKVTGAQLNAELKKHLQ
ncbi:thioredoxin domain-containing protein [Candidatus Daviesbacteria bacterium]|nr:thioredoxin domain-containing protein [Candidatus Daviesbacteria bacterium]